MWPHLRFLPGSAVDCPRQNDTGFYRPRKPPACACPHADRWDSPLYRLVEEHCDEFEQVYPDRFQHKYGSWRPVIRKAVHEYPQVRRPA